MTYHGGIKLTLCASLQCSTDTRDRVLGYLLGNDFITVWSVHSVHFCGAIAADCSVKTVRTNTEHIIACYLKLSVKVPTS